MSAHHQQRAKALYHHARAALARGDYATASRVHSIMSRPELISTAMGDALQHHMDRLGYMLEAYRWGVDSGYRRGINDGVQIGRDAWAPVPAAEVMG